MELKTFINNTLLELNKDLELADPIEKYIIDEAKKKAKNSIACISDDDVRKMIINFDGKDKKVKKEEPKQVITNSGNEQLSLL